jgi:hypothetical protein
LGRNRPEDRQSLSRDLNAALAEEVGRVESHAQMLDPIMD